MRSSTVIIVFCVAFINSCGTISDHQPATVMEKDVVPPPPKPLDHRMAAGTSGMKSELSKDIEDDRGASMQFGAIARTASAIHARMIIKTGELTIEVEKYDPSTAEIQRLTEQWGGFVSSSTTEIPYENVRTGTWILRIPSEKFELALSEIKKLASKLEKESVEGQDVTEEFYDLEARLQNKLLEEKQVRDILRRAGTIHDVLEVQRELSNIREQIERFEGRKKFLMDQSGLSTLTVRLHEAYPITVSSSGGFWATIGSGFSNGVRGFANVLSGTIAFLIAGLPVFVLIAVIIWLLVRLFRRILTKKPVS